MLDSSHGRITSISLHLVYKEDEYNYNYYMMYKNQRYDLDDVNGEAKQDTWNLIVLKGLIMSKNVKAIKNMIEDESHFVTKVVDNDLGALEMFAKHFMGGGGLVVLGGRSSRESKSACGEVGGVMKMSLKGSKLMVRNEECLEGCIGASGGEISRGGDDFKVGKSLLSEIPKVMIGEGGGETFGDDGGAVW
ncbi:hypothetical protein Tco_0663068 [Tanacetum coccineum]